MLARGGGPSPRVLPSPGSPEPLLTAGGRPQGPGSVFPGSSSQPVRNGSCQILQLPGSPGGPAGRPVPLCAQVPGGLAREPAVVTTQAGHFPASLPPWPSGAFWNPSPNKPLASKPCLGPASKERHVLASLSSLLPVFRAPGPLWTPLSWNPFCVALRGLGVPRHHPPEK